jgi:hypothetical protein
MPALLRDAKRVENARKGVVGEYAAKAHETPSWIYMQKLSEDWRMRSSALLESWEYENGRYEGSLKYEGRGKKEGYGRIVTPEWTPRRMARNKRTTKRICMGGRMI